LNFVEENTQSSLKLTIMERKSKNKDVKLVIWVLILIHAIVTFFSAVFSQVTITKPSFEFGYCSLPSNYHELNNIVISETNSGDFSVGTTISFHITAPLNFEFQPNTGIAFASSGGNLSSVTTTVTAINVIIQFSCSATTKLDKLTITGLAVRAVNMSNSAILKRNGGNAVINGLANNTELSMPITSYANNESTFRTVSTTSGILDWNQTSSWECGFVPPNDGSATIIIQAYNGSFSIANVVVFSGTKLIKSLQIETNANFSPGMGSGHSITILGDLKIKTGAFLRQRNWIQNGMNSIKIGGNFTNDGEMLTDGSNNAYDLLIELNGTNPQIIHGTGIFRMIGNGTQTSKLIITNPNGVTLKSNFNSNGSFGDPGEVLINGHLIFDSELVHFLGNGTLQLNGKVTLRAPTFYGNCATSGTKTISNTSTVEFTHPNSSISQASIPTLFLNNLDLSVGNSGKLYLENTIQVKGTLRMNSGIIQTGVHTLEIGASTSVLGSLLYNSGFVNGKLKRWFNLTNTGNSSGLFPFSDPSGQFKRFVLIEYQENSAGGTLQAEWIQSPMGNDFQTDLVQSSCSLPFQITKTASGYWNINPSNGISILENKKYTITLLAEELTDFTNDCNITALKKDELSPWSQSGIHVDNFGSASSPIIQRIDATGWSKWGFAGEEQPLPVELIDFSCQKVQDNTFVQWTTISEYNSMYFELFRSNDGEIWDIIATQSASGYSNSKITYSQIDTGRIVNPYYLLKQVDYDGKYKSYGPIPLYSNSDKLIHFYISSNPFNSDLTVYIVNPYGENIANLEVKDCIGKEIDNKKIKLTNGINKLEIQSINLEKGVYYFTLHIPSTISKTIKQPILK
jgi:hypothetical protein